VGFASGALGIREAGRRELRTFLDFCCCDGCGWKEFEIDWPTLLKKSPTGSAFADRPLKKRSATISKIIHRERVRGFIVCRRLEVKP
jgi:hypothetical protein